MRQDKEIQTIRTKKLKIPSIKTMRLSDLKLNETDQTINFEENNFNEDNFIKIDKNNEEINSSPSSENENCN